MKKKFTENLDSRLLDYSLVAGVVLLGVKEANWSATVNHTLNGTSSLVILYNGNRRYTIKHFNSISTLSTKIVRSTGSTEWIKRNAVAANANSEGRGLNPANEVADNFHAFAPSETDI